jgi:hypothetical protein
MGKVLLINPPYTRYGQPVEIQADEPLGLMSLAAYLREHGPFWGKKMYWMNPRFIGAV